MARIIEKMGASGIFLILVLTVYVIVGMIDPKFVWDAVPVLGRLILRVLPILLLVFGIMFFTNLFFEAKGIVRFLGTGSGLRGWAFAISGGIVSSGPIYMWYPLLGDLKERGMKDSLIAAFLYNRAIKIPLLPMMIFYFGWPFTVILSTYMTLFSVVNGILVERLTREGKRHENCGRISRQG